MTTIHGTRKSLDAHNTDRARKVDYVLEHMPDLNRNMVEDIFDLLWPLDEEKTT